MFAKMTVQAFLSYMLFLVLTVLLKLKMKGLVITYGRTSVSCTAAVGATEPNTLQAVLNLVFLPLDCAVCTASHSYVQKRMASCISKNYLRVNEWNKLN